MAFCNLQAPLTTFLPLKMAVAEMSKIFVLFQAFYNPLIFIYS